MAYDRRDGTLFAAVNNNIFGAEVQRSDDLGAMWKGSTRGPGFDADADLALKKVWHVEPGIDSEPGVVYAGVEPASLFKSVDGGGTWDEVSGLTAHRTRKRWEPGLGGLCLHSMVLDQRSPDRMWVGISAVGVFGT